MSEGDGWSLYKARLAEATGMTLTPALSGALAAIQRSLDMQAGAIQRSLDAQLKGTHAVHFAIDEVSSFDALALAAGVLEPQPPRSDDPLDWDDREWADELQKLRED